MRERSEKEMNEKKSIGRRVLTVVLVMVLVLAAAAGAVAARYPKAARAVVCNWTGPRLTLDTAPWQGGVAREGLAYAEYSDSCWLDLYVPNTGSGEAPPLFVLIHGGGFISNDARSRQALLMVQYFRDHGFAVASVNYRLAQEAPFPGAVQDCQAAIRFLRAHEEEYGYDASDIAVWGESAGGYLACMCAFASDEDFEALPCIGEGEEPVSAQVRYLVDFYGAAELEDSAEAFAALGIPSFVTKIANGWLDGEVLEGYPDIFSFWLRRDVSGMTQEEKERAMPIYYAGKNLVWERGLEAYILHGDCDITVPVTVSEELFEYLESNGMRTELRIVPGAGHAADRLYTAEELSRVEEFLREMRK